MSTNTLQLKKPKIRVANVGVAIITLLLSLGLIAAVLLIDVTKGGTYDTLLNASLVLKGSTTINSIKDLFNSFKNIDFAATFKTIQLTSLFLWLSLVLPLIFSIIALIARRCRCVQILTFSSFVFALTTVFVLVFAKNGGAIDATTFKNIEPTAYAILAIPFIGMITSLINSIKVR